MNWVLFLSAAALSIGFGTLSLQAEVLLGSGVGADRQGRVVRRAARTRDQLGRVWDQRKRRDHRNAAVHGRPVCHGRPEPERLEPGRV